MGTRSIVVTKNVDNQKIIELYKQYDGYPEGLGIELKRFLKGCTVWNGMECLAALLVAELKTEVGGVYLFPPTTDYRNKKKYCGIYSAEYYYEINLKGGKVSLTCWDCYTGNIVPIP